MKVSLKYVVVLIIAAILVSIFAVHHARNRQRGTVAVQAIPVGAVVVGRRDVPVYVDALGTVTPTGTVTVIPQVNGILETVAFREGQSVKRGQVIAHIDSRALEAQLLQAEGTLRHDEAALANARLDLARYRQLIGTGSITRQTLDTQAATAREIEGTVLADTGAVKNLQVQVGYCTIRSPVDGVVGLRLVDPGNYVTSTSTTGIAVITQLQPVTVVYPVPEDDIWRIRRAMSAGAVDVLAYDRDKRMLLSKGSLLALDNRVDTSTGTVKVKAEFPNAGGELYPNGFVNARMQVDTLHDVPVVPTMAIQHGTNGDFVYVSGSDGRVALRVVKPGPAVGSDTAILDNGVTAGDRVITDGADRLDNGALVKIVAN